MESKDGDSNENKIKQNRIKIKYNTVQYKNRIEYRFFLLFSGKSTPGK